MEINAWERVYICGPTQSGKSTLARALIRGLSCYIIYDIKQEYDTFGQICRTPEEFKALIRTKKPKIVIQPEYVNLDTFEEYCAVIWYYCRKTVFIVDEAQLVAGLHKIGPEFQRLITVTQGDKYRIGIWCINQRPSEINPTIRTQATHVLSFCMFNELDARAVLKIPASVLLELKPYYFAWYNAHLKRHFIMPPIKL